MKEMWFWPFNSFSPNRQGSLFSFGLNLYFENFANSNEKGAKYQKYLA